MLNFVSGIVRNLEGEQQSETRKPTGDDAVTYIGNIYIFFGLFRYPFNSNNSSI